AVKLIDLAGSKPRPEVTDDLGRFTGRFANVMGVMDIAILGGRLYGLTPTMEDPTLFATPPEIVDDRTLRSVGGPTPGALAPVTLAADGRIASIRGTGDKITYLPIEDFRMPDRITLRPSTSAGRS